MLIHAKHVSIILLAYITNSKRLEVYFFACNKRDNREAKFKTAIEKDCSLMLRIKDKIQAMMHAAEDKIIDQLSIQSLVCMLEKCEINLTPR